MKIGLPERPGDGHKGMFGTVAIFGGSLGSDHVMLGGPAFAAEAALRTGVGLVVFVGSQDLITHLIEMVPQAVGVTGEKDLRQKAKKWQSAVIGPGLKHNNKNISIIEHILSLKIPTVIDADGLNILAAYPEIAATIHNGCVLTPHIGEFKRLAAAFKIDGADGLAKKLECTVVLKSGETYVTAGRSGWRNKIQNPALATGGTGDVLAGIIGGLLAQFKGPLSVYECACLAVKIHSKAGQAWKDRHGSGGLIISELLALVPEVMEEMRKD